MRVSFVYLKLIKKVVLEKCGHFLVYDGNPRLRGIFAISV